MVAEKALKSQLTYVDPGGLSRQETDRHGRPPPASMEQLRAFLGASLAYPSQQGLTLAHNRSGLLTHTQHYSGGMARKQGRNSYCGIHGGGNTTVVGGGEMAEESCLCFLPIILNLREVQRRGGGLLGKLCKCLGGALFPSLASGRRLHPRRPLAAFQQPGSPYKLVG